MGCLEGPFDFDVSRKRQGIITSAVIQTATTTNTNLMKMQTVTMNDVLIFNNETARQIMPGFCLTEILFGASRKQGNFPLQLRFFR